MQEVITLVGVRRLLGALSRRALTLNHAVGFALICAGAFFVFKGPLPT